MKCFMRKLSLFVLVILTPTFVSAENLEWSCDHGIYDLCGYSDGEDLLLTGPYEDHERFFAGLAAVKIGGKWGFIDGVGALVIPAIYDDVDFDENNQLLNYYSFRGGFAPVRLNGEWGVIDRIGETVLPFEYDIFSQVFFDMVIISDPHGFKLVRFDGEVLDAPPAMLMFPATTDTLIIMNMLVTGLRFGFYDINTGWIVRPKFLAPEPFDQAETMFWVTEGKPDNGFFRTETKDGDVFGLIRADGTWVLEPQFTYVEELAYIEEARASLAGVGIEGPLDEHGEAITLYGVVDETGETVVPAENERVVRITTGSFDDGFTGYFAAHKNETIGLYDFSGNLVGGRFFDNIRKTVTPNIFRVTFDGATALMDGEGNIDLTLDVDSPEYEAKVLTFTCNSGVEVWQNNEGYRIFDASGELMTPHVFSYIYNPAYEYFEDDYLGQNEIPLDCTKPFSVKIGEREGKLWDTGKLFLEPLDIDSVSSFEDSEAVFRVDHLRGIINNDADIIIPAIYDVIGSSYGLYQVTLGDREFWIDETNSEVAAPVEKIDITEREWAHYCYPSPRKGRRFSESGMWGIEAFDGEIALEAKFQAVSCFDDGIAWAPNDEVQMWCPVGPDGAWQSWPECKPAHTRYRQGVEPPEDYDGSVLWMRAMLEYGVGARDAPPWGVE